MDHPEITEREKWGVPDPPRQYRQCHHCDTHRGFERACGCVVCAKCAAECFDCGQSFCIEHTYECDGYDDKKSRVCHSCQSARNYFEAEQESYKERNTRNGPAVNGDIVAGGNESHPGPATTVGPILKQEPFKGKEINPLPLGEKAQ